MDKKGTGESEAAVRTPETNGQQGLGLGLSFVDWIVKAHDGQIECSTSDSPRQRNRPVAAAIISSDVAIGF